MKQVVLRGGAPTVADVPAPSPEPGRVLVANAASVISSGTERASVSASGGGGSLPMRAIRNPDLVLKTLQFAKEHGVRETAELVRGAVSDDSALGYSSAGVVLDTGGIAEFRVGQRVACAGAGKANHAEVVSVPGNLVAPVPDNVSFSDAAFCTIGAIAMQGVRRAEAQLGERIVVVGLGLIGLISVQLLGAAGARVLGIEPNEKRRQMAADFGAERVVAPDEAPQVVKDWSGNVGADSVVITASSASDAIINQAANMLRRKGKVVVVGDVGLGLERGPIYQREADMLISTSYGPGRYDPSYEEGGVDYPIAYVRWTENRNMEEFLRLVGTGDLTIAPLIELEVPVERAGEAYAAVAGDSPPLAAVLRYPERTEAQREVVRVSRKRGAPANGDLKVALVGPGSFVRSVHLPNLKADSGVQIKTVVARRPTSATDVVRSLGGGEAATDWKVAVEDPEVDLVVIGTRHDSHAEIAAAALRAGRAVFVEKPLGLTREQIDDVAEAAAGNDRLAIGFNRPFAPLSQKLRTEVDAAAAGGPLHVVYRVSSPLPPDNWLNDPRVGGGRILGEACHMLDYANWLCGTPVRVIAAALPAPNPLETVESSSITIEYANGSVATVHYSGAGGGSMPKERIEVMGGHRSWVLDDFRSLTSYSASGTQTEEARRVDKGHAELMARVLAAARGKREFEPGIGAAYAAQSVALCALESIASAGVVEVPLLPSGD